MFGFRHTPRTIFVGLLFYCGYSGSYLISYYTKGDAQLIIAMVSTAIAGVGGGLLWTAQASFFNSTAKHWCVGVGVIGAGVGVCCVGGVSVGVDFCGVGYVSVVVGVSVGVFCLKGIHHELGSSAGAALCRYTHTNVTCVAGHLQLRAILPSQGPS
jgi:hypothetical protein